MPHALDCLLKPRSVAIVGASDDPTRIGGRPLAAYRAGGFAGPVYPINPKRSTVQGLPAYPNLAEVPGAVEFALIAVPGHLVRGAVEACIAKGVEGAVVFSAGFAEVGEEGRRAQAEVAAIAREGRVRLLGPNCLGLYHAAHGHFPTFSSFLNQGPPRPGRVGIVSQSGAYGSYLLQLASRRGLDVGVWVTTGNECDADAAEFVAALANDPEIDVIACYFEGVKRGGVFLDALAAAERSGKPVVLIKVGGSAVGAAAAASHTASLAGADEVFDAVIAPCRSVERVRTTEALIDVTYACARGRFPAAPQVRLLTMSGGAGVLMADAAEAAGLAVPALPDAVQARLRAILPYAGTRNPVDTTAQALNDLDLIRQNVEILLGDDFPGALVGFFMNWPNEPELKEPIRDALCRGAGYRPDRVLALSMIATPEIVRAYEAAGYLVFEDPTRAINAVAALARLGRQGRPPAAPVAPPRGDLPALPSGRVGEAALKDILRQAGLPCPREALAATPEEAARLAASLGPPLAVKLASPDVLHKSDIGGVELDRDSPAAVAASAARILERARAAHPQARLDGVLLSEMAPAGIEVILGARHDTVFGPIVAFGLGGLFVEIIGDVRLARPPFDREAAMSLIRGIKAAPLLFGARGREPADVEALAGALVRFGDLVAANAGRFASFELNPVRVLPAGQGLLVLDAALEPFEASC